MIDSPNDPAPTIDRSRPITRAWVRGAATVALLVTVGVGVGVYSVATGTPTASHVPVAAYTPAAATPEVDSPSPSVSPAPTAAWTPCTPDGANDTRKCEWNSADSCDIAQAAIEGDDTLARVLDTFIGSSYLIDPERLKDCPRFLPVWKKSLTGFTEGVKLIPTEVKPGTYVTTAERVRNCYWERSRNGVIIANNFVSGASKVTVTIRSGDDAFTSSGCGNWVRVG